MKSLFEQIIGKCVHFNGVQHKACAAGVNYDSVRDASRKFPVNFPCFAEGPANCEHRKFRTPEEAQAEVDELERGFAASMDLLKNGECMHCGARVEKYVQHGHCAYAEPCGHRMGQADAKALNESLVKKRNPPTDTQQGGTQGRGE